MDAIEIGKVASTYQGKDGCACGCGGKYTYTTTGREAAGTKRGYVVSDEEVNDKRVAKIVNYINARREDEGRVEVIADDGDGIDIYEVKRDGTEHYVYRAYVWREEPTVPSTNPTAPCAPASEVDEEPAEA